MTTLDSNMITAALESCNKIQKIEYFEDRKDRIPTNEASNYTSSRYTSDAPCVPSSTEPLMFGDSLTAASFAELLPWLPVSKGDIKKTAQTRFVNSSPKSYRLMPSSIESSEFDRTSFVEKASHKFMLPVNYFLEIAKLWAISNRSELECRFTVAHTVQESKSLENLQQEYNQEKHKPICHSKSTSGICLWPHSDVQGGDLKSSASPNAAEDLLRSVHRFLASCKLKDQSIISASQIVSLMDKKFAVKLVQQQNNDGSNPTNSTTTTSKAMSESGSPSRKRTISSDIINNKSTSTTGVNVFTVSSDEKENDVNSKEKFLIIHIPDGQGQTSPPGSKALCDQQTDKKANEAGNGAIKEDGKGGFSCFYCPSSFVEQSICARHMLTHLPSNLE